MKNKRILLGIPLLVFIALLAGACIRPPTDGTPAAETPTAVAETATPAASETVTATVAATTTATSSATTSGAAKATVSVNSLRVRALPDDTSAIVSGIKQGEVYNVIGLSSDGLWVQLEIPQATGGMGWVSANFVTVEGSITDINITPVTGSATVTATTATTETGMMTETGAMTETPAATDTIGVTETGAMTTTPAMTDTTTVTATPTATEAGTMTSTTEMTGTMEMTGTTEMTGTASMTTTVVPAPGMAVVTTSGARLRVRSEPNADSQIVGYAYNGETYQVLALSADGQWVQIAGSTEGKGENPNGGWVAAQFLVIGQ